VTSTPTQFEKARLSVCFGFDSAPCITGQDSSITLLRLMFNDNGLLT